MPAQRPLVVLQELTSLFLSPHFSSELSTTPESKCRSVPFVLHVIFGKLTPFLLDECVYDSQEVSARSAVPFILQGLTSL